MTTTTEPAVTDLDSVLSDLISLRSVYQPKAAPAVQAAIQEAVEAQVVPAFLLGGLIKETSNLRGENRQVLADHGVLAAFVALTAADFEALWQGARDVIRKGARFQWSPKQALLVVRALTPQPLEEGPKVDCPEGRYVITGTIVKVKREEDRFHPNYYGNRAPYYKYKWTVQDDRGFKVFGTVPSAFEWSDEGEADVYLPGKRVQFTGTVTRSDRDASFGFVKIPKKVEVG